MAVAAASAAELAQEDTLEREDLHAIVAGVGHKHLACGGYGAVHVSTELSVATAFGAPLANEDASTANDRCIKRLSLR